MSGLRQAVKEGSKPVGFCALGSVFVVEVEHNDLLHGAESVLFKIKNSGVVGWNDKPGRTKEEVLALFDEAIANAEGK